jgi:uncharacterized protein (DUF736 family)
MPNRKSMVELVVQKIGATWKKFSRQEWEDVWKPDLEDPSEKSHIKEDVGLVLSST